MGSSKELFNQERVLAMEREDSIINKHYATLYINGSVPDRSIRRNDMGEVGEDGTRSQSNNKTTERNEPNKEDVRDSK